MAGDGEAALTFRRLEHEAVPDWLAWQIFTASRIEFDDIYGRIRSWRQVAEGYEATEHLVLLDGDLLVCHLALVPGWVRWRGEEARILGISDVITLPGYRSRGLMRRLFAEAEASLRTGGYDFGLLLCIRAMTPFYAKLGWSAFPGRCRYGDPASPQALAPGDFMRWRPLPAGRRPKRGQEVYVGRQLW